MLSDSVIETCLEESFEAEAQVLHRERSEYSTSFSLDNVEVRVDGASLQLVAKDLTWDALLPSARHAKPRDAYEPRREIGVYAMLLDPVELGTARCY